MNRNDTERKVLILIYLWYEGAYFFHLRSFNLGQIIKYFDVLLTWNFIKTWRHLQAVLGYYPLEPSWCRLLGPKWFQNKNVLRAIVSINKDWNQNIAEVLKFESLNEFKLPFHFCKQSYKYTSFMASWLLNNERSCLWQISCWAHYLQWP